MSEMSQRPSSHHKTTGGERVLWIGLIAICVLGMFLCGAMIGAYMTDPLPLVALAALFATAAVVAGSRL